MSISPKAAIQKGKHRRWTREEDQLLVDLYQSHTLQQLGQIFNRGWNKVGRRAMRLGIRKENEAFREVHRQAALRAFAEGRASNAGAKNPNWKGGSRPFAGGKVLKYVYSNVHTWLIKYFGKATHCESKNCTGRSTNYQWAKKRECEYEKKRENFIMLCRSCHTKYDSYGYLT